MHVVTVYAYCLATTVANQALKVLLENSGQGTYRDTHPWLVAMDLFESAARDGEQGPILFATGSPSTFSHWGMVRDIRVVELHRATWETVCEFSPLKPVNPIWTELDSVLLKPTAEQIERERREGIHQHRYPVTEGEIHPYAICETPPFILQDSGAG